MTGYCVFDVILYLFALMLKIFFADVFNIITLYVCLHVHLYVYNSVKPTISIITMKYKMQF